jgi:RNA polymerase sigma-70 factor (sigma-E family)
MRGVGPALDRPERDLLNELYVGHYHALVRLAALLLDEVAASEDVVQEAYVRLASSLRLPDGETALAYLRQTVVNVARSAMRRRLVAAKHAPRAIEDAPGADETAYEHMLRDELVIAVRSLSRRHREVVVLRYFADLTEPQTAHLLGISVGSVKGYCSRALDHLGKILADQS